MRARWACLGLLLLSGGLGSGGDKVDAKDVLVLSFNHVDYLHRWSKDAQHEFTPKGQEDLDHWTDMVTINVHEPVRDGEQLAALANRVLGNYQATGKILKTDSKPLTPGHPAEHFAAAILPSPAYLEAAFARFLLFDGRGVVAVYSHRIYGKAGPDMSAWLGAHGAEAEQALMAWSGVPPLDRLRGLH